MVPILGLMVAGNAVQAQVVTPVSATASTFFSPSQNPVNLINGSGLLGVGDILSRTHAASGSAETMWHSGGGVVANEWLVFDLGAQFTLTGAHIWQMNQPCCLGRGVKDFGIFVSSNTTDPREDFTFVGGFSLTQGTGLSTLGQQSLSFNAADVRRVMFAISNCWSGQVSDYVGLSEVRFAGSAPATIATQPADATNYVWGIHTFSVTAGGTPPLTYQWFRDGAPPVALPNATNTTYRIEPVQLASAGGYFVVVTGPANSVTSRVATLTVLNPTPDYASELIAHWTFDEGTGSVAGDSSGNNASATLYNFPFDDSMWVTGRLGGALEFNRLDTDNSHYVLTDGPLNLANHDHYTFAFWAKRRSDNNPFNPRFIGPVKPVESEHWVLWRPGVGVGFWEPQPSPEPVRDIWQHFVVTFDRPAGRYELYVDGLIKVAASGYVRSAPAPSDQWVIGHKELLNDHRDPWRGYFDDFRVYNRILRPGDVKGLFDAAGAVPPSFDIQPVGADLFVGQTLYLHTAVDGTPPVTFQWYRDGVHALPGATNMSLTMPNVQPTDAGAYTLVAANLQGATTSAVAQVTVTPITSVATGLAGYWMFDETFGSTAADTSGRGNHGTVFNSWFDGGHWTNGKVGGALSFRGPGLGDDYVVVPAWPTASAGSMTLAAWVWADARPDRARIACGGSGGDGIGQFLLTQSADGSDLRGYVQNSARAVTDARENVPFPTNSWQHVALVADGEVCRIYRNGAQVASVPYNGTLHLPTNALSIGARLTAEDTSAESGWWQGKIDDVAYWTRGLGAGEIFALFAAGQDGQPVTAADDYLNSPPVIVAQPQSVEVYLHEPFALSVTVASPTPPSFQWHRNGEAITGATAQTYSVASAHTTDAGAYAVVATSGSGSVTSSPATVTVLTTPPQPDVGMVVHLKLDDGTGWTAADASGQNNYGSLINFDNPDANWTTGILGGALNFNQGAPNAHAVMVLDLGTLEFGPNPFSLSLWAKGPAAQLNSGGLLCKGTGGQESYCIDVINNSYRFFVRDMLGQAPANLQISPGIAPNDTWQHLAVICNPAAGQSSMYVNGVLVGTAATTDSVYYNGASVDIGARQGGGGFIYPWRGLLDDVRIYSRAITPLEVRALTYQGIPPALTITTDGDSVTISWPLEALDYELVYRELLTSGQWLAVPGVSGNSITLPATGAAKFFALRQQ